MLYNEWPASYPMMNARMHLRFMGPLACAFMLAAPIVAAADVPVREQFRTALDQAERGVATAVPDSLDLRRYILYPDLQGARLLGALRRSPTAVADRDIGAFLDAQPSLPVSRELRRAWLLNLAERRQWTDYLRYYEPDSSQSALTCHYYQARVDTTTEPAVLAGEMLAFWQDAPQMPQACVAPFNWLKDQGRLDAEVTERRARKALADGNADLALWLIRSLPPERGAPLQRWADFLKDSGAALERLAAQPVDAAYPWEGVLSAFARLSPRSPQRAGQLLQRLGRDRFGPERYAELQRWVALGLAWDREPAATTWFESLPESYADDRVQEWRVRAALWNRQYDLASMWLHRMPATMAAEPRWAYWRGRSLEMLGRQQQSRQIFEQLAQQNGYYSLLSAWRLGQPYRPTMRPFTEDLVVQSRLLEMPTILRARELLLAERDSWASLEWRRAIVDLDAETRIQAARLAALWGWTLQAVTILAALDIHDMFEISYPDPFGDVVATAARDVGVPGEWIYAVMRQESLFNPRAASSANAYGLLQLLLPTAREVAKRRGDPLPQRDDLLRPEINVPLGATFLRELRDRFGGQMLPALAGYNAGPGAARRWLPAQPLEPDVWIENIPYNETRSYVQRVLWHVTVHRWRLTGDAQNPAPMLQAVRVPE